MKNDIQFMIDSEYDKLKDNYFQENIGFYEYKYFDDKKYRENNREKLAKKQKEYRERIKKMGAHNNA